MTDNQELPAPTLSPDSVSVFPRAGQPPPLHLSCHFPRGFYTETNVPAALLPHWGTALTQQ